MEYLKKNVSTCLFIFNLSVATWKVNIILDEDHLEHILFKKSKGINHEPVQTQFITSIIWQFEIQHITSAREGLCGFTGKEIISMYLYFIEGKSMICNKIKMTNG